MTGEPERLDSLRDRLIGVESIPEGWADELRATLEPWLASGDAAGDDARSGAARRLLLMAEVWECLAAEGDLSAGQPGFFVEALARMGEGLLSGELGPAAAWILRESEAGWSEYLALLDPSIDPPGSSDSWGADPAEPEIGAGAPAIDVAALLRTLTGSSPEAASDPPPASPLEAPPEPIPVMAEIGHVPDRGPAELQNVAAEMDPRQEARTLDIDPEIRTAFAADLSDLFNRIQDLVLGLGGRDEARRLHELGRCYHTLKGAAGSVGLTGFASEVHDLEDRLERAGDRTDVELDRRLDRSLEQIEALLCELGGPGSGGVGDDEAGPAGMPSEREGAAEAPEKPGPEETEGLVRVPADRFEEMTDLCSELLTRRGALADQAERLKQLADAARACSQRLRTSVDQLGEATLRPARRGGAGRGPDGEDQSVLVLQMAEQVEDLFALAATVREAAAPATRASEDLSRLVLRLWESLQSVRIVPVRGLFRRLVRVARDAARVEGREVEVELIGGEAGADRALLDKAYEPLLHAVRNAVGHGIEAPEDRARAGKPAAGRLTLEARREGHTLALAVQDDGRGLDYEAIAAKGRRLGLLGPDEEPGLERLHGLLFQAGFSTRAQANMIAGRGVGMDVVAREVELLRGRVELTSHAGLGTRLTIRLPARLSLEQVMVVRVGGQALALPVSAIDSVHQGEGDAQDAADGGGRRVAVLGERCLPVADLGTLLGIPRRHESPRPILLVLGAGEESVALRVDRVDGALELVIRPLGPLLAGHPAVSGFGLTTGGEVIPALDAAGLLRLAHGGPTASGQALAGTRPRALVVDDSMSVRRVAARNLRALGLEVEEATDGEQALGKLRRRPYHLILTDLDMPRMDGFALLAELERTRAAGVSPVVVTSTRSDAETRRRVLGLGARAFVAKPVDAEELAAVVGELLAGGRPAEPRGVANRPGAVDSRTLGEEPSWIAR